MSDVVIVGAGLAGLACALRLQEAGVDFTLVEAADRVGGRVRTDSERGYLFDRGFQVFLTSYPEARRLLDYDALELRYFESGATVFCDGEFHPLVDPWRHPAACLSCLFSPVGSFADKLRIARLRSRVCRGSLDAVLALPEKTTAEALAEDGFTEEMVEVFFRPFLGGIFLERELVTSSRKFHWLFRMFSKGRVAVPARGMQQIPLQLAGRLPPKKLMFNARVARVMPGRVSLEDGRDLLCRQIVIATDPATAVQLFDGLPRPAFRAVTNLYYSLDEVPMKGATLLLNGSGRGLLNNLVFITEASEHYAPKGRVLASAVVLGDPQLDDHLLDCAVREQLVEWFGMSVGAWKLEKIYRIREALPDQPAGSLAVPVRPARLQDWLVVAGDWRGIASINGALESGRLAAEAVLEKVL